MQKDRQQLNYNFTLLMISSSAVRAADPTPFAPPPATMGKVLLPLPVPPCPAASLLQLGAQRQLICYLQEKTHL